MGIVGIGLAGGAIENLGRELREVGVEVVGGFDHEHGLLRRINAERGEDGALEGLAAGGVEDQLYAGDLDERAIAHGDGAGAEGLLGVADETFDGDQGVDGLAGAGTVSGAEAEANVCAFAGGETVAHRLGIPDGGERGVLDLGVEQCLEQHG
jgi:hypothetical protein